MSNRVESRINREYRRRLNAANRPEQVFSGKLFGSNGDLIRGEGRRNFPYGPRRSEGPSIFKLTAKPNKYPIAKPTSVELDALTRDQLRALAKERGLSNYGKLNKAGLVELLS